MKPLLFLSLLIPSLFLTGCSCSKEEEKWGQVEMWKMAKSKEPSIELVFLADTPEGQARRVLCAQYPQDGCVIGSGKRILVRRVEVLVVQYESTLQACKAAAAIGQWYARNWIFDDVTNEPVLEDFVKKVFDAKKPASPEDCAS
jgi:hypothetical protein